MKIHVNEMPVAGLEINHSYASGSLSFLETKEIKSCSPMVVSGLATREGNSLHIKGKVAINIEFACSRCLANFEKKISRDFRFDYFLDGEKTLDITNDICQEIILEYSLKPLCRQDCKGLCALCGQNLNERECECDKNAQLKIKNCDLKF